ncbi:MAG: ATP-grasp domain-containing protein [Azospirillum sp.]|nr:ATP-grasp domain-containing protein [Azospirillum sp.]
MRLFVCEYITAGGLLGEPLPRALAAEGLMMRRALVEDLRRIGGVTIAVTRDHRIPQDDDAAVPLDDPAAVWPCWGRLARQADALWPIAPESGGALERLSALAPPGVGGLLGCRPDAVRLAASKGATQRALAAAGVATVPTWPAAARPETAGPWVVKPDDGAGACDTALVEDGEALAARGRQAAAAGFVVQPLIAGVPLSLSMLCRDGEAWLLTVNRQQVGIVDGNFRFEGVTVGVDGGGDRLFAGLADRVAATLPGLWGYVGVDLILPRDGPPLVLEVNPRLTTSYVGLGRACGINPAAAVLALHEHPVSALRRPLTIRPVEVLV